MIKPLNQLNAIFDEILKRRLSGSEQLILLHLYNAFNRSHWTESIELSDESLLALLNQFDSNGKPASIETIRRAKQKLKNKRLIDFEPGKGSQVTTYKLVKLYPEDTPDYTPDNTPADTPEDTLIKFTPKLSKQEDVKTIRLKDNTPTSSASASAMIFNKSEISKELARTWKENVGEMPRGGVWLKLLELEQERGTKALVDAINKAAIHNTEPRLSVAYVMRILENPMKERGAIKSSGKSRGSNGKQDAWDY